jgi:predicted amidohydrolase
MKIACGQMQALTLEQSPEVWPIVEKLATQAAEAGADLLVLPETTYPAYWLDSPQRYMQDDILRTPAVLERFAALAASRRIWLVVGFVEEQADNLYNSAAVFNRAGKLIHVARKNFLWDCDNRWFTPGDSIRAFDTEFGRIGVLICADCRAPEIAATLVADGATLLVLPTAWVNASKVRRTYRNVHPEFLIRARAMEFGVPFACASKAGREGDLLEYVGQSQIVSPEGKVLAVAPNGGEHLIVADVEPTRGRKLDMNEELTDALMDTSPAFRASAPAGSCTISVRANADDIAATLKAAGVRTATLPAASLQSFAVTRDFALKGVQVLVAKGRVADDAFARARAAENRIFVIVATDTPQFVVDPDGQYAWRQADLGSDLQLDIGKADIKRYTPQTDLWAQRRVECYRLGRPIADICIA